MDHRAKRNLAGDPRTIRLLRTDEVRTVSYREAVGLVSRGLAVFHVERDKPKRAAKKAATKKSAPVSAEAVYADPTSPITPEELPGSTATGDAAATAENKPHDLI